MKGVKYDDEKLLWQLLPYDAIEEIVKVMTLGAKKYNERNWEGGMKWSRIIGALFRHVTAWYRGQDKDPETGLSHLAHAGCCILFLIAYEKRNAGEDDRPLNEIIEE